MTRTSTRDRLGSATPSVVRSLLSRTVMRRAPHLLRPRNCGCQCGRKGTRTGDGKDWTSPGVRNQKHRRLPGKDLERRPPIQWPPRAELGPELSPWTSKVRDGHGHLLNGTRASLESSPCPVETCGLGTSQGPDPGLAGHPVMLGDAREPRGTSEWPRLLRRPHSQQRRARSRDGNIPGHHGSPGGPLGPHDPWQLQLRRR